MNPTDLRSIETYIDAPRGTLEYWLADDSLHARNGGARDARPRHRSRSRLGGWLSRIVAR